MKISGRQVAAARDLLGLSQAALAESVGVGSAVIDRFENGRAEPYARNLARIREELERRGIEFTNGDGIGVRLNFAKAAAAAQAAAKGGH